MSEEVTMSPHMNALIDVERGRPVNMAMQRLDVTGRVYPLGAFVRVVHRFRCVGTKPIEAIYVAMLPTGAALRRFKVAGKSFEAESRLEPHLKARRTYENALEDGHLAVLAETAIDGLTHLSVGQIRPNETITVIMELVVGVQTTDRGFQFRYPLTLAPNYHRGARLASTDGGMKIELPEDVFGDLVLPEWRTSEDGLHEIGFELEVLGGSMRPSISSPSHRISVAMGDDGAARIGLRGLGETPNRDIVIDVGDTNAAPRLFADATLLGRPSADSSAPAGAARWAALIPSSEFPKPPAKARRVVFLLDRSGSMSGIIERAKQALSACLSALEPEDRFNIIAFGSDAVSFAPRMLPATDDYRQNAEIWAKSIKCDGGTEMLHALSEAGRRLHEPGDIFIITDGQVSETASIVERMASAQHRVHVLGIGTAAQHRFMAQLARRTNGTVEMVSPSDDVGLAGLKLFNRMRTPVLESPTITVGDRTLAPVPAVFDGVPLVIDDPAGDGSLVTSLSVDARTFTFAGPVPVPNGLIALLAAGRRLEDLSSRYDWTRARSPEHRAIEREMAVISTTHQLASRVMSLVAVIKRVGDRPGETPEQRIVPIGIPEGMSLGRTASMGGAPLMRSMPAPDVHVWLSPMPHDDVSSSARVVHRSLDAGIDRHDARLPENAHASLDLLVELGSLSSDGGLRGASPASRLARTVTLAFRVALESQKIPASTIGISTA